MRIDVNTRAAQTLLGNESAELEEATEEFDEEFVMDTFRPMTSAERRDYKRWIHESRGQKGSQGQMITALAVWIKSLCSCDTCDKARLRFLNGKTKQAGADFVTDCGSKTSEEREVALGVRSIFAEMGDVEPEFIYFDHRLPEDLPFVPWYNSFMNAHYVFDLERRFHCKLRLKDWSITYERHTVKEVVQYTIEQFRSQSIVMRRLV